MRKRAKGDFPFRQPEADWGQVFYMLGRVYSLDFLRLLEYPITLIFLYYEWAIYDFEMELYIKTASL